MKKLNYSKRRTFLATIFFSLLLSNIAFTGASMAQNLEYGEQKTKVESTQQQILHKGFTIRLIKAAQYMQSVQLVLEMQNHDTIMTDNCWFHLTLLTPEKTFLYREQPLLFSQIQPLSTQRQELLCESVGLEELGFVVLHPVLYESGRSESAFNFANIRLEVTKEIPYQLIFSFQVE